MLTYMHILECTKMQACTHKHEYAHARADVTVHAHTRARKHMHTQTRAHTSTHTSHADSPSWNTRITIPYAKTTTLPSAVIAARSTGTINLNLYSSEPFAVCATVIV